VIDKLVQVMAENERNDATLLERKTQEYITEANERVSSFISKGGELITSLVTPAQAKAQASQAGCMLARNATRNPHASNMQQ
jgi:hypothetical protein